MENSIEDKFYEFIRQSVRLANKGIYPMLSFIGMLLILFALVMKSRAADPFFKGEFLTDNEFLILVLLGCSLPIIGYWLPFELAKKGYKLIKEGEEEIAAEPTDEAGRRTVSSSRRVGTPPAH